MTLFDNFDTLFSTLKIITYHKGGKFMNKAELVSAMADQTGLSKKDSEKALIVSSILLLKN